ncbi:hypothetical protein PUMCH_001919 [Australozyma saopauloensis]|uniref:Uncharacterized protein n=1 Tax=Australozyma saopauloensis TaxID=291208 RepID=A0AAX4H8R1_9ASCO|nr:hypothetical protein PUMCH_001919 [[Candida] saopauloensis]
MFRLSRIHKLALRNFHSGKISLLQKKNGPAKGNFLINAINYVKDVDDRMAKIETETPQKEMAAQLVSLIEKLPELLALLLLFHYELYKVGVSHSVEREFLPSQIRSYRWAYLWKLSKIHDVFWELCNYLDIAQHPHPLGFLPTNIGILDPANFTTDQYNMLQRGEFNGLSFKDIMILGSPWSSREHVPSV